MGRIRKYKLKQAKYQLEKLDTHRFSFFSSTLNALDQIINQNAPVLIEKKGKNYGIKVSTTKYPDKLNLVYRERGGGFLPFLKAPKTILYGIEFSYGIPEITPWFISSQEKELNLGKFGLWREKPRLWERIRRKKVKIPRGIDELLSDLGKDRKLSEAISNLIKTTASLKPAVTSFDCFHKWGKNTRPNLAMVFHFNTTDKDQISPERNSQAWHQVVRASCSLLMAARELVERYRARHY